MTRTSSPRLRAFAALIALASAPACASGPQACKHDVLTGSDQCQPSSGDVGEAVGTAVAAGAAWAAVGCTVNGCEHPYRCNGKTKLCERIRCDEGKGSCPAGYACDPEDHLCK